MNRKLILIVTIIVLAAMVALIQQRVAGSESLAMLAAPRQASEGIASSGKTFDQLMTRAMEVMHQAMQSAPHTGDSDRDFVTMMIPHHQGAIDMAKALLLHGKDEQLRRLAQEIITDQQNEVALMRLWLSKHPKKIEEHPE